MKTSTPTAIRLTRTPEVTKALAVAKKRYPTLTDAEILKVGLAELITNSIKSDMDEIRTTTTHSLNIDGYLDDPNEDVYQLGMGKKVNL